MDSIKRNLISLSVKLNWVKPRGWNLMVHSSNRPCPHPRLARLSSNLIFNIWKIIFFFFSKASNLSLFTLHHQYSTPFGSGMVLILYSSNNKSYDTVVIVNKNLVVFRNHWVYKLWFCFQSVLKMKNESNWCVIDYVFFHDRLIHL